MTIEATLARVEQLKRAIADPAQLVGSTGGVAAPATGGGPAAPFASALAQANASYSAAAPAGLTGTATGGPGGRILAAAESQLGQSEQPPGSNESPAIAEYRGATAGAVAGAPWCAYFASWAARQGGEPLGAAGQGLGSVSELWSWAQGAGRALANGPGVVPSPGDLIVFGSEHVGVVKGVLADGRVETIEGNFENKVSANTRGADEASGYVRMS